MKKMQSFQKKIYSMKVVSTIKSRKKIRKLSNNYKLNQPKLKKKLIKYKKSKFYPGKNKFKSKELMKI